jgi:hypothetical protein
MNLSKRINENTNRRHRWFKRNIQNKQVKTNHDKINELWKSWDELIMQRIKIKSEMKLENYVMKLINPSWKQKLICHTNGHTIVT